MADRPMQANVGAAMRKTEPADAAKAVRRVLTERPHARGAEGVVASYCMKPATRA